jgi:hypothetical protein
MTRDPLTDAYRRIQEPGSPACPTPESLTDLALGATLGEERARLADHVVSCRRCSEGVQILLATNREARRELGAARSGRLRWLALAAATVLAVLAGGLLVLRQRAGVESADRGAAAQAASVIPLDASALVDAPARFEWPAVPQAEGYRVKLFRDSGDALWESDRVTAPHVEIPTERRASIEGGRSYYWVVEVEGPLEKSRLGPFTFRVSAPKSH